MKKGEVKGLIKQRERHSFSLIALIICTTANIFIFIMQVLNIKIKLFIPYSILLTTFSLQLGNSSSVQTGEYYRFMLGVTGAVIILGIFIVLYFWSEKNNKAYLYAFIFYFLDTAFVFYDIKKGNNYGIVDFIFHIWALYSLIVTYSIGKQLKIDNTSKNNHGGTKNVKN